MTRFLNGRVLNLLLVAGIGLPVYYATTLTEREGAEQEQGAAVTATPSQPLLSTPVAPGAASRSVNVAYHRSYPVDWRRRYHGEHAHVQRLLDELRRARHVQAHEIDWRARQIAAAETIGHEAGADPWPNCPDPIWNGAPTWDVTVACENSGDWMDSPGYYRCGLQFDPMWETRFGRLCP